MSPPLTARSRAATMAIVVAAAFLYTACDLGAPPDPGSVTTAAATATSQGPVIEWVPAPDGDLPALVLSELERARKDGRELLVYVGATWCEPCSRFHEAAERGEITGLPPLRILELDLDRDQDRLTAAGYGSRMIPLFVLPGPDGRGTGGLRLEGGIKGEGAAANIASRLRKLLSRAKGS